MKKNILLTSNNNTHIKTNNPDKKIKISSKLFSIKFIPYNKILNDLLLFLQKKLSPPLFNEIYKYFLSEVKKYFKRNIFSNNITNNVSFNTNKKEQQNEFNNKREITEFCYKNENSDRNTPLFKNKTKINLKKYIQPFINLSYSQKFRNDSLNNKEISSFSNYINNKNNESYPTSIIEDKNISYILPGNNFTIQHLRKINKIIKKNKTNNNSIRINKQSKNKIGNIFLKDNKYNYNTIHTAIIQNDKNKNKNKITTNNNKIKKLSKTGKINSPSSIKTVPNLHFKNEIKKLNKNKIINRNNDVQNVKDIKNIKNAVVINNTFFNKFKNNYNFGFIPNEQKKIKIVNIKLKEKDKNGNLRIINPIQNSEEMLDKIKKSLDDESLKVMLNFSYENFLSKESERDSKEYSIGGD